MLVVLSGGGTAGHINPALALADVLQERGCDVRFAGTPTGVEARLVREAGIPFTPFEAQGFNRNHPLTLPKAVRRSRRAPGARGLVRRDRRRRRGGFRRLRVHPVARAAEQLGVPVVVHEQNSVMGMANKYLAKRAAAVCLTYEHAARRPRRHEPRVASRAIPCAKRVRGHARGRVARASACPRTRACCW